MNFHFYWHAADVFTWAGRILRLLAYKADAVHVRMLQLHIRSVQTEKKKKEPLCR
jgi:hypothetical protein